MRSFCFSSPSFDLHVEADLYLLRQSVSDWHCNSLQKVKAGQGGFLDTEKGTWEDASFDFISAAGSWPERF